MGLIKTFKIGALPVIDGIVARGRNYYTIAIKKTNGNILLDKGKINFISHMPIIFIRGIISLVETGILTCKMLSYSAKYFDTEEKSDSDTEFLSKEEWYSRQDKIKAENSASWLSFIGILLLIILGVVGFFMIPVGISSLFFDNVREESWILFNTVQAVCRIVLLILYFGIFKISGGIVKKFRKYHAAANMTLNCFEDGKDITLENIKRSSKFHPRSVSYIVFLALLICTVALIFIKINSLILALLIRFGILLLSIGVAYEISRLFGMFNGKVSRGVAMAFGMWIENFTLDNPDDIELYVAMTAIKNAMIEE